MMTKLRTLGAAAVLALGVSAQALAVPTFTVDPTVIGNDALEALFANAPFNATAIGGTASTLVTLTDPGNGIHSGVGYIAFTGFEDSGSPVGVLASGLGLTYQLWVEFNYTAKITSGSFGAPGSVADVTSLNYTLKASTNANSGANTTTFTPASATGTGTTPSVAAGATTQILGGGALLSGVGGAVINGQLGASLNTVASYQNTPFGDTFFIAPVPFFNIAFNAFNQTGQGISLGTNASGETIFAVNSAVGAVDFNRIPEPATLALLGVGLLGIGATSRRRVKS